MKISFGKQKGLEAVSTRHGVIAALAIDQREALRKLFAKASGKLPQEVPPESLIQFKEHVSRVLTPRASAILLDPEYGLPAALARGKTTGLLLAYEKTGYDRSARGRLPSLLDSYSVARLRQAGADGVKVLLYYSPFSDSPINAAKHAWVERVGAECVAADIPFFLEVVGYHDEMDEKSPDFARIKPSVVTLSIQEFSKPRYFVDVLKVGVPVNMSFVESAQVPKSQCIHSREEARAHFRRASDAATRPFIYLSEGVSNETFAEALTLAAEANSAFSGVLCGRAIWQEGVPIFVKHGAPALDEWLHGEGLRNIEIVNALLQAAHPWYEKYSVSAGKD